MKMEKGNESGMKMFVRFTGTGGGTMIERALKEYARERYDYALIEEERFGEIAEEIMRKERELNAQYPKWRDAAVWMEESSHGVWEKAETMWVYIGGEAALTGTRVRVDYTEGDFFQELRIEN